MKKHYLAFICLMILTSALNAGEIIKDANLERCNYDGKTINEISFCSFEDVNLKDANLHNAAINHLNMSRGIIAGANFDGAHISNSAFNNIWPSYWGAVVKMPNMYIEKTTFTNIDFSSVDFSGSHFSSVVFEDCEFNSASLKNCKFNDVVFKGCNESEYVSFENSEFNKVSFNFSSVKNGNMKNCKFNGVIFGITCLSGANFTGSKFYNVSMSEAYFGGDSPAVGLPEFYFKMVEKNNKFSFTLN